MANASLTREQLDACMRQAHPWLELDVASQRLTLFEGKGAQRSYLVSTARNGVGEMEGSNCTPRGWHIIRAKIGAGMPSGTVFRGRRPTGELYSGALARAYPDRDWILTRILWLSGMEPGFNRLGRRDTMRRYIYIHGCPDACPMGRPESAGCVRMRNDEVVDLFDRVPAGTPLLIHE